MQSIWLIIYTLRNLIDVRGSKLQMVTYITTETCGITKSEFSERMTEYDGFFWLHTRLHTYFCEVLGINSTTQNT